jgi:hypothetical protein
MNRQLQDIEAKLATQRAHLPTQPNDGAATVLFIKSLEEDAMAIRRQLWHTQASSGRFKVILTPGPCVFQSSDISP